MSMLKPPTERLYLEDLYVGQRFTSAPHLIDAEQIKALAAEFDPQPFISARKGRQARCSAAWPRAAGTPRP